LNFDLSRPHRDRVSKYDPFINLTNLKHYMILCSMINYFALMTVLKHSLCQYNAVKATIRKETPGARMPAEFMFMSLPQAGSHNKYE